MATVDKLAKARVESLANHLTLPAQLPGRKDPNLGQLEPALIDYMLEAASKLGPNGEHEVVRRALQTAKILNAGGRLQKTTLLAAFKLLKEGDFLILHIVEQNCGLVVRRDHEYVCFLSVDGRLQIQSQKLLQNSSF